MVYGNETRTKTLYETALFIALIAIGSSITIPMIPVPITLQTLFVLLCGCIMKRRAVIPLILYIALGALGLPVFHQFTSGIGVLLSPTGGYLVGFIFAALIVGLSYESKQKFVRIIGLVLGSASATFCGVLWISISTGLGFFESLLIGALPFMIGEIVKIIAAYTIAERVLPRIDSA